MIQDASKDKKMYGGYSATNLINMVARTVYVEGHAEGTEGRKAILSVIKNRSGGDMNKVPSVISKASQFSCWNKMTDSDWKNYVYNVPSNGVLSVTRSNTNREIWRECVSLAV